jgi:hypothetical protein
MRAFSNKRGVAGRSWREPACDWPTVCLCIGATKVNVRFCRGQGHSGLPWCGAPSVVHAAQVHHPWRLS